MNANEFISLSCQSLLPHAPDFNVGRFMRIANPDLLNLFADELSILVHVSCINDLATLKSGA
jgi:hypothetical protein